MTPAPASGTSTGSGAGAANMSALASVVMRAARGRSRLVVALARRSQLLFDARHAQLGLNAALHGLGHLGQRHAAHDLVEEPGDKQVLGDLGLQPTAHEVEALVLRYRAGRGAVRALDVVGRDLELRDRHG